MSHSLFKRRILMTKGLYNNSKHSYLGAPAIFNEPVRFLGLGVRSVTDQQNGMICQLQKKIVKIRNELIKIKELGHYLKRIVFPVELAGAFARVVVDTIRVVHKVVVHFKRDGQRTRLNEGELHQLLVAGSVIAANVAVLGNVGAGAFLLVVQRVGWARRFLASVRVAFFRDGTVILGVFASHQVRKTSLAALAVGRAADNVLRGQTHSDLVLGGHAEARFDHSHGREGIAASTATLVPAIILKLK